MSNNSIKIKKGFIFKYTVYMPVISVKYIKIKRGIIEKIFKINSITIYTNSGSQIINSIDHHDLKLIKDFLITKG